MQPQLKANLMSEDFFDGTDDLSEDSHDHYDREYFETQGTRLRETNWKQWDARLTELFLDYPASENNLLEHILQRFKKEAVSAFVRVSHGGPVTNWQAEDDAEDAASKAVLQIYEHLKKGDYKTPIELRKHISFFFGKFEGIAAEKKKEATRYESLTVEHEDSDGTFYEVDNPAIYEGTPSDDNYRRSLPSFIQGTDLRICQLIRQGQTYEDIADILEMSVAAITQRIKRMRERIQKLDLEDAAAIQAVCPGCQNNGQHTSDCLSVKMHQKRSAALKGGRG